MLEGRDLLAGGHAVTAAFYLAASLAVGLAAVALGIVLARLAVRPGPGGRSST
jgi:fluoride ion exporter CrcB/FEX